MGFEILFLRFPPMGFTTSFEMNTFVDIHPDSFASLYSEAKRVGTREVGIVVHDYGFAIVALDHCSHLITKFEVNFGIWMVGAAFGVFCYIVM